MGCEVGCPTVADGTCDTCSDKDTCTAVSCAANKFNPDVDASNGCEVGCPTVAGGTCDTCSDKDTCTAVTCTANKFDTNSDATDGCEDGCPIVAGGTCNTCSDKDTCTASTDTADGCKLDGGSGCNDDAQATCSLGDGINLRTCTCVAGHTGTNAALTDDESFSGCTATIDSANSATDSATSADIGSETLSPSARATKDEASRFEKAKAIARKAFEEATIVGVLLGLMALGFLTLFLTSHCCHKKKPQLRSNDIEQATETSIELQKNPMKNSSD